MGDVGFHGGRHGGWVPLNLPSPLSPRLHHLQLGRGGPGHGTSGVAATDQPTGRYSAHCRLTADRRPSADKAIRTMLDSLGSLTFELLCSRLGDLLSPASGKEECSRALGHL